MRATKRTSKGRAETTRVAWPESPFLRSIRQAARMERATADAVHRADHGLRESRQADGGRSAYPLFALAMQGDDDELETQEAATSLATTKPRTANTAPDDETASKPDKV